jgi:hypothetical protein
LFVSVTMEAVARRDRMMGWLALSCLLVGLRHAVLALGTLPTLNPDLVDRAQSLLVAFGFLALCSALSELFPRHIPRRFPGWIVLGLIPNFIRNLLLPHPGFWDTWMHNASNLTFLLGCGFIIAWTLRAQQDGDQMAKRLFLGFLVLTLPVVLEVAALSLFDMKLRLSGFSLVILAMTIGNSWRWLEVNTMESRIHGMEIEVEIWRGLVPGTTFRTDRPNREMEGLFGEAWPDQIRTRPAATLVGSDGATYRFQSRILYHQERAGWYERDEVTLSGQQGFLSGWTVGLGIDDAAENTRIQLLLRSWGADPQVWGTVPPREGPYPSVLLWAREPSILAVWREGDLLRRRLRWIQIGGPITESPHARLEPGASELDIQRTLDRLLSRR